MQLARVPGMTPITALAALALAFTIDSPIGKPCHEQITGEAVRRVRQSFEMPTASLCRDENLLLQGLPFTPPNDLRDLAGMTVLIGVRDPDLKGLDPTSLQQLVSVHGNDDGQ